MTAVYILAGVALAYFGFVFLNDNGTLRNTGKHMFVGYFLVLLGMIAWMLAMGELKGLFAYLGIISLIGMLVSITRQVRL